ncbi:LrgB family protein [Amphibacillus sp. MSJ-3]|uniref:LrgB family protein n=1 Tax=Amphibacillus sp. MSJ-3 TaxID=2841505 RepID=UPI001C0F2BA2|nr:LrgB family protein [Amphibacillus sp. MSJ-3]MBU5594039.1 LrgB family protein [Amphibacillus sp. MSJ-3]
MNIVWMTLLTVILYGAVKGLEKRFPILAFHPLILTPILIVIAILLLDIPLVQYQEGTSMLTHLLGPATIAFAIPIYKHFDTVKAYFSLILVGVFIGSIVAIFSTLILSILAMLEEHFVISLLPRSITTPLAIEVSKEIGAIPSLTIVFVIITGLLGSLIAPFVFDWLKIETPLARGIALGMAAHAVGTNRALQYGEEATTYSTLAMIFAGIITTVLGITLLPWLITILV